MNTFGIKITREEFQKRANVDISEIEQAFLADSLNSFRLTEYLEARSTKEFFQNILARVNPDVEFIDAVEYFTKPSAHLNPLNRSTSTMSNLLEDFNEHLKAIVYNKIVDIREVQRERAAE